MHEYSLISALINKIEQIAGESDAKTVTTLTLRIGALAHMSADHLREHFTEGSRGTIMESAELVIEESDDTEDPGAQDILLKSISVE